MFGWPVKKGVAAVIPVRMYKADGTVETNLVYSAITATLAKQTGTTATVSPVSAAAWTELTAGAFSGKGVYLLSIPVDGNGAPLDVLGHTTLAVNGTNSSAVAEFDITDYLPSDVMTRLGTPAGASVSVDMAAIKTDTGSNVTNIGLIKAKTDNLPVNTATAISAIPTNPLLTTDVRLPAVGSGKVIAAIADLPPAPDNVTIGNINAKLTSDLDVKVSSRATPADVNVTVDGGFSASDRTTLEAIPSDPLLANDARLPAVGSGKVIVAIADLPPAPDNTTIGDINTKLDTNLDAKISTRATPADVNVTVDGGFSASDRTKLESIPSDPVLVGDARLPAVGSGKVVASISDLPPAPDNAKIGEIDTALTALEKVVLRIVALLGENRISDNEVIDESGRVTSARIRIYATKAAADAEDPLGLLCTYTLLSSYNLDGTAVMKVTGIAL